MSDHSATDAGQRARHAAGGRTRIALFHSFGARLLALVASLVAITQLAAFYLVDAANTRNARAQIATSLEVSAGVFQRLLEERSASLVVNARLLSGDFAFKQAFATHDHRTVLSAMENHLDRIDADLMALVDMNGEWIADTSRPRVLGGPSEWQSILDAAAVSEFGEASGVVERDGHLYLLTVVPLFTPDPSAWILFGFIVDDAFARQIGKLSDVSVMVRDTAAWRVAASTLVQELRPGMAEVASRLSASPGIAQPVAIGEEQWIALATPIGSEAAGALALLTRSLTRELEPFAALRAYLTVVLGAGLLVSLGLAVLVSRSVTRPVLALARGASRVAQGDYATRVPVVTGDEIGHLAETFNSMAAGLEDRERVRSLLGLVVSPAIAEEMLSHSIELGGEEREVSVLFADIRGFTARCEQLSPAEALGVLNRYLTGITEAIENSGGVVDKYIGDAVMALFGAPVSHGDDAARAIRAALAMQAAVQRLNEEAVLAGAAPLHIGIGIHSARVVAGRMGSTTRLNYTVIGDGVNLASRIEGLTRHYGVGIIVTDATRAQAPGFSYRKVDVVRVKGRQEPVAIHEPITTSPGTGWMGEGFLRDFERAQRAYRSRDWASALAVFEDLALAHPGDGLLNVWVQRCRNCLRDPPGTEAELVTNFAEK